MHKPIQGTIALGNLVLDSLATMTLWAEARPYRNHRNPRLSLSQSPCPRRGHNGAIGVSTEGRGPPFIQRVPGKILPDASTHYPLKRLKNIPAMLPVTIILAEIGTFFFPAPDVPIVCGASADGVPGMSRWSRRCARQVPMACLACLDGAEGCVWHDPMVPMLCSARADGLPSMSR